MSKIYDALQNVHRQKRSMEPPPALSVPFHSAEPAEVEMVDEMLSLYKIIDTLLPSGQSKIIQFAGATEGEGTSTIVREFAKVVSDLLGHSVLLLDTDRHHPSQDAFFDIRNSLCWLDALKSGGHTADAFHRIGQSKLFVSPSINSAVSTPEIFNSKFVNMCQTSRATFDLVLIDSAPLIVSPDGFAIASKVDGVILVVEAEKTRWQTVKRVRDQISRVGGYILGVVLNKRRYYIPKSIYTRL